MRDSRPVLLVEDSPDEAFLIEQALAEAGTARQLVHQSDAERALAYLRSTTDPRPAVILLDLHLPGMTGAEFLKTIKRDSSLADIPVVVLSVSDVDRDILDSFDRNAAGYIVKPAGYEALVQAVRTFQEYWSLCRLPRYQG